MPKLVFFCGLDADHEIRDVVLIAPSKNAMGLKTLRIMAKRLALAGNGHDYLAVCGENNERKKRPWLVLTDVNLTSLEPDALAYLKAEMTRLLTYSDCLKIKPHSSSPQLIVQEDLCHWEQWFRHLPSATLSQKPDADPLQIQLQSPTFLWSLATILIALSLLCRLADSPGLALIGFVCYGIKLLCIAGLLIGTLIIPVFGALTEQTRILSISQAVLFLCFQTVSGNLWFVEGIANTLVKTAILFTVNVGIGKVARLLHDSVLRAVLVQSISMALGVATVIWVLAYSLF